MTISRIISLFVVMLISISSMRAVELRFVNWDGEEADLKFTNKGKTVTIRAAESTLSPVYSFDGPGPLVLFKEAMVEGKTVRQTAATLSVPPGLTHAIVVVAATDESMSTYAGVWIDDAPASRPASTVRVVNLSRHSVAFKVDVSEFTIPPSGNHQVPVRSDVRRILMQAAAQVEGRWTIVANNPLPVRAGLRVLLLLRDGRPQPGSEVNLVDMLSFYDRPPAAPDTRMAANNR